MAQDRLARLQKVGILKQADWSTVQSNAAAFDTQPYDIGSVVPDPDVTTEQFNWVSANGITEEEARIRVDSVGGMPKMSFSGVVMKELLAPHLAAIFQSTTEGAATPYTKFFKFNDSMPDFANDDGYVYTLALANYTAGGASTMDGIKIENAILDSYTLSFQNDARGIARLLKHSGTWVGNAISTEQVFADSADFDQWDAIPASPTYFGGATDSWTLDLTIGTNAMSGLTCWRLFEMTVNNNVTSDCKTTGGKAGNYKISPTVDITLDLPYNSSTYKTFKDYVDGDNVAVQFYNGTGSVDDTMSISFLKGYLTANPYEYNGDYQAIRVQARMVRPTSGGWTGEGINFSDDIDWAF